MDMISEERWQQAQEAESLYWESIDQAELARITYEKLVAVKWALEKCSQLASARGPFVEIGIGPLGVGCIHFLPGSEVSQLVGIDPLPLTELVNFPSPFMAFLEACRRNYQHIQAMGERNGLPDDHYELAVSYNVLDHVQNPEAFLNEAYRILRSGGVLLLGCDVVSVLSKVKFHLYTKRKYRDTIGVMAHPFRFLAVDLIDLVTSAGFEICAASDRRHEYLERFFGHAHRFLILGRKR